MRARIFVDLTGGQDTGLAVAPIDGAGLNIELVVNQSDGMRISGAGNSTLALPGNGHRAAFAGQLVADLPSGFRGALELLASRPFAAVTLRSLVNARGDFLLTTFPVADLTRPVPAPLLKLAN